MDRVQVRSGRYTGTGSHWDFQLKVGAAHAGFTVAAKLGGWNTDPFILAVSPAVGGNEVRAFVTFHPDQIIWRPLAWNGLRETEEVDRLVLTAAGIADGTGYVAEAITVPIFGVRVLGTVTDNAAEGHVIASCEVLDLHRPVIPIRATTQVAGSNR